MTLAPPKSQKAVLLKDLIAGKIITESDYPFHRFRGHISDFKLKHELPLRFRDVPFKSQFGHPGKYRKHYLLTIHKKKAIQLYNKINGAA